MLKEYAIQSTDHLTTLMISDFHLKSIEIENFLDIFLWRKETKFWSGTHVKPVTNRIKWAP